MLSSIVIKKFLLVNVKFYNYSVFIKIYPMGFEFFEVSNFVLLCFSFSFLFYLLRNLYL